MNLIVLTGYSGSGKTELGKKLETIGYVKAVTNTTRDPRVGEVDGIDYHFKKSKEDFFATNLIEYAEYPKDSGKFYGLSVDELRLKSDKNVYAILEVNGATKVKALFPNAKIFFINCSISTLRDRMIARGDSVENIEARLNNINNSLESTTSTYADYVLDNNGTIEDTFNSLKNYLIF